IVTRPEKFFSRSCPPARMETVRSTRSVWVCSEASAGAARVIAPRTTIAGICPNLIIFSLAVVLDGKRRPEVDAICSVPPKGGSYRVKGGTRSCLEGLVVSASRRKKPQPPRVDGHSGDGVHADALEP